MGEIVFRLWKRMVAPSWVGGSHPGSGIDTDGDGGWIGMVWIRGGYGLINEGTSTFLRWGGGGDGNAGDGRDGGDDCQDDAVISVEERMKTPEMKRAVVISVAVKR